MRRIEIEVLNVRPSASYGRSRLEGMVYGAPNGTIEFTAELFDRESRQASGIQRTNVEHLNLGDADVDSDTFTEILHIVSNSVRTIGSKRA